MHDFYGFVAACRATEIKDTLHLAAANSSSISTLVQRLVPYTEYRVQMIALSKGKRNGSISMRSSSVVVLRTNEDGEEWLIFNNERTWVSTEQQTLALKVRHFPKKLRFGNTSRQLVKVLDIYVIFLSKGENLLFESFDLMILRSCHWEVHEEIYLSPSFEFHKCYLSFRALKTTQQTVLSY